MTEDKRPLREVESAIFIIARSAIPLDTERKTGVKIEDLAKDIASALREMIEEDPSILTDSAELTKKGINRLLSQKIGEEDKSTAIGRIGKTLRAYADNTAKLGFLKPKIDDELMKNGVPKIPGLIERVQDYMPQLLPQLKDDYYKDTGRMIDEWYSHPGTPIPQTKSPVEGLPASAGIDVKNIKDAITAFLSNNSNDNKVASEKPSPNAPKRGASLA